MTLASLKHVLLPVIRWSGTLILSGRLGVLLILGLVVLLALTGAFGRDRYRDASQKVLAILLGRKSEPR
jgi:hypothetical protein